MVDTGLMRKNEFKSLYKMFKKKYKINVKLVNKSSLFLKKLKNISDPEKKRKIIGKLFIKVFENEAKKIKGAEYLAQGTLYPDVIESKSVTGSKTSKIKSHHNVGGLPKNMKLKLVEPLRHLFKDEVRKLGMSLGLDKQIVNRHPFPGLGLAIRIIGKITSEKLKYYKKQTTFLQRNLRTQIILKIGKLMPHYYQPNRWCYGRYRTYEYLCLLGGNI